MPNLYIANCTQQIQVFMYRLPESKRSYSVDIPIGGQVKIPGIAGGELGTQDIESITNQHAKYGMIRVDEIDRSRPFFGTCWSERPINADKIRRGVDHNLVVLDNRGQEIRKLAAVGAAARIEQEMPGMKGLEVAAIELDDRKTGKTGEFSDALRVDQNAPRTPAGSPNRSGRRNRAA